LAAITVSIVICQNDACSADVAGEGGVLHRLGLDRLFVALAPEEVESVLARLAGRPEVTVSAGQVERFCAELRHGEEQDDPLLEADILYEGHVVPLVLEYIREGETQDELMVLGPPPVVEDVRRQIASLYPTARVRLVPAVPDGRE
jgi:hypothetical protein